MRHKIIAAILLAGAPVVPALAQDEGAFTFVDQTPPELFTQSRSRDVLAAQILLNRSRHSPGVIDGAPGSNTERAIRAYQRAGGLEVTGEISPDLLRRLAGEQPAEMLRRYTLTQADVSGPFHQIPRDFAAMAELDRLAYERPSEKIAEKFHMGENFLRALNPGVDFGLAGTEILVAHPRDGRLAQPVTRIEVDKTQSEVRAYADDGTLLASYPATVGSSTFPSPNGSMTVNAVAPDAAYYFNPEGRLWGPDERLVIAAGPNNPVGGIWIDLSEDGYGIHGSADPQLIGKTTSHGCVRLTNWDARELAQAVSAGTVVEFT